MHCIWWSFSSIHAAGAGSHPNPKLNRVEWRKCTEYRATLQCLVIWWSFSAIQSMLVPNPKLDRVECRQKISVFSISSYDSKCTEYKETLQFIALLKHLKCLVIWWSFSSIHFDDKSQAKLSWVFSNSSGDNYLSLAFYFREACIHTSGENL